MSDPIAEQMAQPDDFGEIRASELHSSLGERLGAQASEAFMGGVRTLVRGSQYLGAEHGVDPLAAAGAAEAGVPAVAIYDQSMRDLAAQPDVSIEDAKARLKQEGLEGHVNLPEQPTIRGPVLDLMIDHGHERRRYEAAVNRGPQGFFPDALGFLTELGVGMIDPVNMAAFSIPVLGEARWGKMMTGAGESLFRRGVVRTAQGAAQGAVGGAALVPADWWLQTEDGHDYTFADALRSVVLSAGMGAGFHAAFGAAADVIARMRGKPLPGREPSESSPVAPAPGAEPAPAVEPSPIEQLLAVHPAEVLSDLPDRVREDAARAAVADVINDRPVRINELLEEAAKADPRVAETVDAWHQAVDQLPEAEALPEPSAEGPIYDDILRQLRQAGLSPEEARHNAAVVAARYATRGQRLGVDPFELYREEGLQVRAGEAVGVEGRVLDQARRRDLVREREADGQLQIPGAERIGQGELAQRKANEPLKPKTEQKPMDVGLFGDESKQRTLFQSAAGERAAQTETPAFKAWFGDSKMVDDAGNPLVFYHGTRDAFDTFSVDRNLSFGKYGGAYFAREPELANFYARGQVGSGSRADGNPQVYAVYLKIENPKIIDLTAWEKLKDSITGEISSLRDKATASSFIRPEEIAKLKAEGYDGIVNKVTGETIVFDPEQIKSATGNTGSFSPTDPRIYNQAPTFFSAAERAIDNVKQDKAPAQQWLGTIKNLPGVKPEELEWLGLEDWLKGQKGPVSKQAIADYVRANQIEVMEVTKGLGPVPNDTHDAPLLEWVETNLGDDSTSEAASIINGIRDGHTWEVADLEGMGIPDDLLEPYRQHAQGETGAKFGQWQLPGGENYRELLLTLPDSAAAKTAPADLERINAESSRDPQYVEAAGRLKGNEFRSSHWAEPNVLAHVRFNDRTIDGKRTLFLEEVQSDWHQKGKREGYKQPIPESERPAAIEKLHELEMRLNEMYPKRDTAEYAALDIEAGILRQRITGSSGVPDAPFKTTWPELALKRMIRYAAEQGYDSIAWTPGEVQAARYDLSKQVDALLYKKHPDGVYSVQAIVRGSSPRLVATLIGPEKLADVVGKDVADKIIQGEGRNHNTGGVGGEHPRDDWKKLAGLDLKVGGEGMAGFYDKILPAAANKLGKKFGAKVGKDILDQAHREFDIEKQPNGEWIVTDERGESLSFDSERRAELYVEEHSATTAADQEVHTLELTPELKQAAIEQGFPLFQGDAGEGPRGRITLTDNKAIVDLFKSSDRSTFMHEASHLWLDELTRDAAREHVPQALKEDLGTVLRWLGVTKAEDIGTAEHEKWATAFERYLAEGKAPSAALKGAFDRFREWLLAIYRSLAGVGHAVPDEIRGVMDRMLASDAEIQRQALANLAERRSAAPAKAEKPAKAPRRQSLIQFLAANGGIRSDDPLVADVRSILGRNNMLVPGLGSLIRKPKQLSTAAKRGGVQAPKFLDHQREAAVEAGYLQDAGAQSGRLSTSTVSHLLDAMDRELRGNKIYPHDEATGDTEADLARAQEEEDYFRDGYSDELDKALVEVGLKGTEVPDKTRNRVVELMLKEGVTDPLEAYERAVMEETQDVTEKGEAKRIGDHIPGWDFSDDAGAAPAAGGPAEGRGPGEPGAAARPAGAGDRAPDWQRLAGDRPDDADLVAASQAADAEKEPASTDPTKAPTAAEKAAAEADSLLEDLRPKLSEDERQAFDDALAAIDADSKERLDMVQQGAACLAAAVS